MEFLMRNLDQLNIVQKQVSFIFFPFPVENIDLIFVSFLFSRSSSNRTQLSNENSLSPIASSLLVTREFRTSKLCCRTRTRNSTLRTSNSKPSYKSFESDLIKLKVRLSASWFSRFFDFTDALLRCRSSSRRRSTWAKPRSQLWSNCETSSRWRRRH